jgi:hypothetical protein
MYRMTGSTSATVAIGLVAVFLVAGMVGGGLLGAPHSASGQPAKGSPAGSAGNGATFLAPAARTYQTTINLVITTSLGSDTPVPQTLSFYANVTWGSIDNTNTHAWVVLNDLTAATHFKTFSLNGTINTAKVVNSVNNGVPYANYTWNTNLNKTTLGCAKVSCADLIPATDDNFAIIVWVSENGASMGGGPATTSMEVDTILVSTYVSVNFITPFAVPYAISSVPLEVQFSTNISWGYTTNATTNVALEVYNFFTITPFAFKFYSFNGSVNATNAAKFTSHRGFNGTVNGVQYSYATWTLVLNKTTLGCATVSCNTTLPIQTVGYQGLPVYLIAWTNESGASAGGQATPTGLTPSLPDATLIGSTMINAGTFDPPLLTYQPLPYVASGWINSTWVNPAANKGNSTVTGYVHVIDDVTSALLTSLSLNNSVNTTNTNGVSLSFVKHGNGTTPLGTPFVNYTWSIALSATATSLGVNVPYDPLAVLVNATANGNGHGGVKQYTGYQDLFPFDPVFVQYPTTVSAVFTSTFGAYIPTPFNVNFTLAVTNAPISAATTTITVLVKDLSAGTTLSKTTIAPADNQTAYVFAVDAATLACSNPSCSALPQDEFGIAISVAVNGTGLPTNGSVASAAISHSFFLITTPLSASLVSPGLGSVSLGNVTLTAAYLGSWVAGAVINIYSSTGSLVFTHSIIELTPGVPATNVWFAGTVGTYTYSIVMTTVYLPTTHYFNGTLSVITKGGTVYQNSSTYSNNSVLPGLSGAVAGTILLLVGLIVGMIVALVFGRAVWGGRPTTAPPQAWEGKPAAGANTCSVCGKTFTTPEELAAHGKSEHGMQ